MIIIIITSKSFFKLPPSPEKKGEKKLNFGRWFKQLLSQLMEEEEYDRRIPGIKTVPIAAPAAVVVLRKGDEPLPEEMARCWMRWKRFYPAVANRGNRLHRHRPMSIGNRAFVAQVMRRQMTAKLALLRAVHSARNPLIDRPLYPPRILIISTNFWS